MNIRALLLFCFLLVGGFLNGQDCPTGSLSFSSQADIDAFLIDYPNCTEIEGDLNIDEFFQTPITDLSPLQNLTAIGGELFIYETTALSSLSGLGNIVSIGSDLWISKNSKLSDISALSNLNSIEDLIISFNDSLANLSGLQNIESVSGNVSLFNNPELIDLSGLDNLTVVNGFVAITRHEKLISLSGLNGLSSIGGNLRIAENLQLIDLTGLDNLVTISEEFELENNQSLVNLFGLGSLDSIGSFFRIKDNASLINLTGLENLISVNGNLTVEYNDQLTSLSGMVNLTTIDGYFGVSNNDLLTEVGLTNLRTISEGLEFYQNYGLTSLSGLHNLTYVGDGIGIARNEVLTNINSLRNVNFDGLLQITENESLSECSIPSFCNHIINEGEVFILFNLSGCGSSEQILDNCSFIGKIQHPVFYDMNENGIQESDEPFYGDASVTINPGNLVSYGNLESGGYAYQSTGDYVVTYNSSSTPNWELTTPDSYDVTLTESNPSDTIYFGLKPTNIFSNLESTIATTNLRCNDSQTLNIYAENTGTTFNDGTLWLQVDPNITSTDFIETPDTIVAPNLYGWHFTDLYPSATVDKQINLGIPGPPNFTIGDALEFQSYVTYTDTNGDQTSDTFTYNEIVDCAYDPNDKLVNPIYPFNYALIAEPLTYTIRFQNTGNAEAYNVVIRDTLDPNLDPTTFRVIASSHDQVLSTELKDNQYLSFNFIDIFLPDSTTNFEGSQGFVMYSIQAYDEIPELTQIANTAGIYFDFNPPIITNTTENTMVYSFDVDEDGFDIFVDCDDQNDTVYPEAIEIPNNGIDEDCDGEDLLVGINYIPDFKVIIFPNPTTGKLTISFGEAIEGELILRDYTGKMILTQQLKMDNQIDMRELPNGLYMVEINTERGTWVERVVKN